MTDKVKPNKEVATPEVEIVHKPKDSLDTNSTDVLTNFTSAIVSAAPLIGPPIGEAIKTVIPNQRMDRVVEFVRNVEERVTSLEKIVEQIQTPEGLDLLEDVTLQATRAMTDERRKYLANILINGLTKEELSHIEKKKLVSILGELNDIEVLHLKSAYLILFDREKFKEFMRKHHDVIRPASSALGAPESEAEYKMFQDSYKDTLNRFWLTENKEGAGGAYNKITPLGRLLIEYIEDPGDEIR